VKETANMHKQKNRAKPAIIILLLILLSPVSFSAPRRINWQALRYTRKLPAIDRVELQKLKASEMAIESIVATQTLQGRQAKDVARVWRTQKYAAYPADCHYPAYGIKFFSKQRLILYASLCWQCDNIEFITPKLGRRQRFDGDSPKGKQLLEIFKKAFSE
jgi:hypothetical protein